MKSNTDQEAVKARVRARLAKLRDDSQDPAILATQARWDREAAEARALVADYEAANARRRSGIPDPDAPELLHPADTTAILAARAFLASESRVLLLSGPRGTGKTAALRWAVAQRPGGRFLRLSEVLAASDYDGEWWGRFEGVPFLAVDEWMGSGLHALAHGRIFRLLNARWEARLGTALATNLTPAEWQRAYGVHEDGPLDRLLDRLRETTGGGLQIATLDGPSLRAPGGRGTPPTIRS